MELELGTDGNSSPSDSFQVGWIEDKWEFHSAPSPSWGWERRLMGSRCCRSSVGTAELNVFSTTERADQWTNLLVNVQNEASKTF